VKLATTILAFLFTASASQASAAGVADLAWMTGSWSGSLGPGQLEENWSRPLDGSIASLVRMRGDGATSMIELIVIEEEGDSLVLRIQQWDPGFKPRTPNAQAMSLVAMGERTVSFKATEPGGLTGLTYSRPADDTFTIDVETAEGGKFQITMSAF